MNILNAKFTNKMRTISEQRQTQVKSLGNLVDMLGDKTLARQLNEKVTKTV